MSSKAPYVTITQTHGHLAFQCTYASGPRVFQCSGGEPFDPTGLDEFDAAVGRIIRYVSNVASSSEVVLKFDGPFVHLPVCSITGMGQNDESTFGPGVANRKARPGQYDPISGLARTE